MLVDWAAEKAYQSHRERFLEREAQRWTSPIATMVTPAITQRAHTGVVYGCPVRSLSERIQLPNNRTARNHQMYHGFRGVPGVRSSSSSTIVCTAQ